MGTEASPVPFGGRDREIDGLNAWLEGKPNAPALAIFSGDLTTNNLLITAPSGRGKTALLVRWFAQLQSDWLTIFVPVSIRAETNQAVTFYQTITSRLAESLGETVIEDPRYDLTVYYKNKFIEYLDRISKGDQKYLVVIDGLDEARGWSLDTTVLPVEFNTCLKFVISARELAGDKSAQEWLNRLGWVPPLSGAASLQLQPLSRENIADVLTQFGPPLGSLSKEADIIDELYRLTEQGDPLVLQCYVNELLKRGGADARLKVADFQKLEPGFGAYIKRWLDEQKTEWKAKRMLVDEDLIDVVLAVLTSAYGPLKLPELEALVTQVLPGNYIFSVRTIEPLKRFILGDGRNQGYILSHPNSTLSCLTS